MQTKQDFAGSTDMWSTLAGGHLMKVVNLAGFTVPKQAFSGKLKKGEKISHQQDHLLAIK
jgi:hypothetical protein